MALSRRTGQRFQASIWPGFVDAMTGLLLVLMFVLTIFMIVQFVLRETITGQEDELNALETEVLALAEALGLERDRSATLESEVGGLRATLDDSETRLREQAALIAALSAEREAQDAALAASRTRITSYEAQVAALLSQRDEALGTIATLEETRDALSAERDTLIGEREALNLALAQARDEIDTIIIIVRIQLTIN